MRCLFTFILLALIATASWAQQQITYFDADWNPCAKEQASYFRTVQKKDSLWEVKDYYITNQLQMSGTYLDDSLKTRHGHFVYYHDNGEKSSEGNYVRNESEGRWTFWHRNGKVDGKGSLKNDKYVGDWFWYFDNGAVSAEEYYNDQGDLQMATLRSADGKTSRTVRDVIIMPEFKGGQEALVSYLQKNIHYPDDDRIAGNEGRVMIGFVVTQDGNIQDIRVLKSVSPTLDNEAVRVVGLMPKWNPGLAHNRPVSVKYSLPVVFKLTD